MAVDSPYKFLDYYDTSDKDLFFGRERETNILVSDVVVNRLVVLFARTGRGKTSLINAGVRPELEKKGYRTFYIRVEQDPTKAARDAMLEFLESKQEFLRENKEAISLVSELKSAGGQSPLSAQLISAVKILAQLKLFEKGPTTLKIPEDDDENLEEPIYPIVLFFDQFEEFFIQINDPETRRKFITDISEVYRNADSGVHLVFSMREEYFHEMDEFRSDIPSIFNKNSNLRLLPLNKNQAQDAVLKPASAYKVEIHPALAQALTEDLWQDGGINPTTLQIICDTLWRNSIRSTGNQIDLKEYQQLGGWRHILDQRLEDDIDDAVERTELLSLMQRLIPELRTERNTKYARLISDLVKSLDTSQESLQELLSRLKKIHVAREITVSGVNAVEWASDYLAERTDYLLTRVRIIELRRLLKESLDKAKDTQDTLNKNKETKRGGFVAEDMLRALYLSVEELEQFSKNINYLTSMGVEEVTFLFNASLFHRQNMKLWFDQASRTNLNPLNMISQRIHDKQTHINLRLGAVHLLLDIDQGNAVTLLKEALDEPDLAREALDILVDIPGERATSLLAEALDRDDLWQAALVTLTRTATERGVILLEPLLKQEAKFSQALNELERIARSGGTTADIAEKALESAIPNLEALLQKESNFSQALNELERLAEFSGQIGIMAEKALEPAVPKLKSLLKQEGRLYQALNELERLTKYNRSQAGNMAEKAIESGIPLLESLLQHESNAEQARNTLVLLAKSKHSQVRNLAQQVVKQPEINKEKPYPTNLKSPKFKSAPRRAFEREIFTEDEEKHSSQKWDPILTGVNQGTLIPIISNSFRIEQIFRDEEAWQSQFSKDVEFNNEELTINEQLTKLWAEDINYPMADDHNIARVAQYYQVEQRDGFLAKSKYLEFLKSFLLEMTTLDDSNYADLAHELKRQIPEQRFSEIVQQLDYPRFPEQIEDPLRLLARLPLPIYVTTSYYDFLERALFAEQKAPRTQICFWNEGKSNVIPEHYPDPHYEPTPNGPLVYHLYGLEDYPRTLVMSEDDHINFLMSVAGDIDTLDPIIPIRLRAALHESIVCFLAYQQLDTDFRWLYRLVLRFRSQTSPRGIVIQQKPRQSYGKTEKSLDYLIRYFDKEYFGIEWDSVENFIYKLWDQWNKYRQGQET